MAIKDTAAGGLEFTPSAADDYYRQQQAARAMLAALDGLVSAAGPGPYASPLLTAAQAAIAGAKAAGIKA